MLPLIFVLLVLKIMILVLGRINDNDPSKYHDYFGIIGFIMITIGLIYLALFLYGI